MVRKPRLLAPDGTERCRLSPSRLRLDLSLSPLSTAEMTLAAEASPVQVRDLTAVCSAVFDVLHLPEPAARALRCGQFIDAPGPDGERAAGAATATGAAPAAATGAPRAAMHPDGHVVALVEDRGRRLKPVLVLDPA